MEWLSNVDLSVINQTTSIVPMFKVALMRKFKHITLFCYDHKFSVEDASGIEKFIEDEIKYHKFMESYDYKTKDNIEYIGEDGAIRLGICQDGTFPCSIHVATVNKSIFDKISDFVNKIKPYAPEGVVKMLMREGPSYALSAIGKVVSPFEAINYNDSIVKAFKHIDEELKVDSPCGRLSILHGSPGTGKSFFIKGLITANSSSFVFVPSSLVGQLSGPELAGVLFKELSDYTDTSKKQPIVLIMEDADVLLSNRKSGSNLGQLGELLNFSDGILGDIANIRVVATTNASTVDIDPAYLRSGRLCTEVKFESLTPEKASEVFNKLTSENRKFDKSVSLSDVYKMAREKGWAPKKTDSMFSSMERDGLYI